MLHAVLRDLLSICSRSAHALMLIQVQVRFDAVEANTHVFVAEEPSPLTSPELGYQRAILSHVPPARSSSPTELDDRLMMQGHSALDAAAHDEQDSMLIESRANRALHCPSVESRIPPGPAYAQAYLNALATMSTDGPAEAAEIRRTLAVFLRAWQAVLKAVRQRRRSCALASARLERLRSAGIPTVFGTWRSCAKLAERHRRIGLRGLARARCALLSDAWTAWSGEIESSQVQREVKAREDAELAAATERSEAEEATRMLADACAALKIQESELRIVRCVACSSAASARPRGLRAYCLPGRLGVSVLAAGRLTLCLMARKCDAPQPCYLACREELCRQKELIVRLQVESLRKQATDGSKARDDEGCGPAPRLRRPRAALQPQTRLQRGAAKRPLTADKEASDRARGDWLQRRGARGRARGPEHRLRPPAPRASRDRRPLKAGGRTGECASTTLHW